ncbi:MAG TPA: hypothetical protein VLE51_01065 [Candidatus Saccharimonadales bacterium]|nr:hypothetical protein [Candidatus Saccharimonadales bacterium]
MVKRVKKLPEDSPDSLVDVFEAIRRALVKQGLVRQKTQANASSPPKKKPKKLVNVAMKSHEILFKANTVFPFTLFPDTVTLDREKLSFANRIFFGVSKVTSVPVRDILSVEVDTGPFFGSVHTASRYFITNPKAVNWLWRNDAIKLQRLLQGYIIAHEQEIDCANIKKDKLIALLNDLGSGDTS